MSDWGRTRLKTPPVKRSFVPLWSNPRDLRKKNLWIWPQMIFDRRFPTIGCDEVGKVIYESLPVVLNLFVHKPRSLRSALLTSRSERTVQTMRVSLIRRHEERAWINKPRSTKPFQMCVTHPSLLYGCNQSTVTSKEKPAHAHAIQTWHVRTFHKRILKHGASFWSVKRGWLRQGCLQ